MASNFHDDLKFSESLQNSPVWLEIYNKAFPDYLSLEVLPGTHKLQSEGVDCIIQTESGHIRYIEEKNDKWPPRNLFIEYMSAVEYDRPGWIEKPVKTDYLLYLYHNHGVAYVIRFKYLKAAWEQNKEEWQDKYKKAVMTECYGGVYTSLGCAVPVKELQEAIDKLTRLTGVFMRQIEF